MTNQEEPKALKAILIAGPKVTVSDDIRTLFDNRKKDCLIIGGNRIDAVTAKNIESTLKQKNFKITENTRIDINAHGCLTNDGQHKILIDNLNQEATLTWQFLQALKDIAGCPLYVHVWSCYGGSANKATRKLDTDIILVTHTESKLDASEPLNSYANRASLERYLEEDLTPYQQFIRDFPENFEAATFNKRMGDKTEKFKFTRMRTSKDKKMADILKNISSENNLTDHFNGFFAKEAERFKEKFKAEFQDADAANAINSAITSVSELNEQTAKTFATGVLMHLCAITADDELDSFKELLNKLLEKGININDSIYGLTLLHYACSIGKISVIKILLTKDGIDINTENGYGNTPLHLACKRGYSEVVALLLTKDGIDINAKNKYSYTPLYLAYKEGYTNIMQMLLTKDGVKINAKDGVEINAKDGVEINAKDAVKINDKDSVKINDKDSVKINAKDAVKINAKDGETPLHFACKEGRANIVQMLLTKDDVEINAQNKDDETPLHFACKGRYANIVQMLLTKDGVKINAQNKDDETPLHFACKGGYTNIVKMLLTKDGVDINAKSNDGSTPLHLACLKGHIEVIKELLKIPTIVDSLTMKNNKGEIPLELIPEGNTKAIALLTEAEKSMHSKDKNLALDNAEEINDLSVNQQMSKDNSEQLSNNELQNDLKLTELLLVGHTEDIFSDCYGA